MIVAVSDLSFIYVEEVVGLGLVVEEVDSPTKTIAVIPSTRLMYSSSFPCENYTAQHKIVHCIVLKSGYRKTYAN